MPSRFMYIGVVLVVLIGIALAVTTVKPPAAAPTVQSFEECAALYPVLESYPEQCKTPDGRTFVRDIKDPVADLIEVVTPQPNAVVASPLVVTGKARGPWYFEASFPVTLLDAHGTVLAQLPAQALSDWMTTAFVPFTATLQYKTPKTINGTLVLHNDNPSGDPERDLELRIPVRFASKPMPRSAQFGEPVMFMLGEDVLFPNNMYVRVNEIRDSRCKPNVQCIWQGEISVGVEISFEGEDGPVPVDQKPWLGTVIRNSVDIGGYVFTLQTATPSNVVLVVEPISNR